MRTTCLIKLLLVSVFLCLFAVPKGAAAAKRQQTLARKVKGPKAIGEPVAIWKLTTLGLDKISAKKLRQALSRAIGRSAQWQVLPESIVRSRLGKAGLTVRSPAQEVARALRVSYLLTGALGGLGNEISVDLRLLDGKTGAETRRVAVELPRSLEGLAARMDELVVQLLSPEKFVGGLALVVTEDGAKVFLDGVEVATTPLVKPLDKLSPGKHILMIRKEGFSDFSGFVFIPYGSRVRVEVDLSSSTVVGLIREKSDAKPKPRPSDPTPVNPVVVRAAPPESEMNWQQVVGWTSLGLAGAAALSGGFLAWHANDLERQVEDRFWTSSVEDQTLLLDRLKEGDEISGWSSLMILSAGAFTVVSAGFLLWGYLADGPPDPDSESTEVSSEVSLTPAALPNGFGVGLQGRF